MTKTGTLLMCAAVLLVAAAANGQTTPPQRVRGTITNFDGKVLSVQAREGRTITVELADDATVATMSKKSLADIKPGTPLGTTAVRGKDGTLVAREVHLFPTDRPVPNEGHRDWDLEPGSSMTNGTVSGTVQATAGHEMTLNYKGGSQKVVIPESTPIVMAMPADRSALKRGETVFLAADKGPDGKLITRRVQVSKDGVKPPQ
jgi:hypothetical protein